MDVLGGLRSLLGISARPKRQEDDALVMADRRRIPLSSVERGQQWQPLQGAPQYDDSQRSSTEGITGAVNPLLSRDFSGRTSIYSPGEGLAIPRSQPIQAPQWNTQLPDFSEIIKRFR